MRSLCLLVVAALATTFAVGCSHSSKAKPDAAQLDGGTIDAPPDAPPGTHETTCETLPPVTTGTCEVTGSGTTVILKGTVLAPGMTYHGGQVAIGTTGQIACVGCNCAQGGETVVSCPDAVISPGFINTHDHIEYTQSAPKAASAERYEDRQQWRNGGASYEGHTKITHAPALDKTKPTGLAQLQWGELRFLMGGATSVVGSATSAHGLVRNLDFQADQEAGLSVSPVDMDTFPLDDLSKGRQTANCDYGPNPTTAAQGAAHPAYEPHTSEGIDDYAHNEFLCESSTTYDTTASGTSAEGGKSHDLLQANTAMIHSIAIKPAEYQLMAQKSVGMVWSPRSNISLYADTARLPIAARMGVEISLGTDWLPSGSMNVLRELKCADNINTSYFHKFFSDEDLWKMATSNAASITHTDAVIGALAQGKQADISIFAAHGKEAHRAILDAEPQDVVLVMRGGKPLYGDATLIDGLTINCDQLDVCGTSKKLCLMGEINTTLAALTTAVGTDYPLFSCTTPTNEPSCTPARTSSTNDPVAYTGIATADDNDGDGIPNATDKCPDMFDPIRPMDHGAQADTDGDGLGDICDPCPLDANTTTCTTIDPNDRDGDGVPNATDNCPDNANPTQIDSDGDGKGDACDACPTANAGTDPCVATIYDVKNGTLPVGMIVKISNGLVTGKNASGFFMQYKQGDTQFTSADYSGIFVYAGTTSTQLANAVVGRRVEVTGTITSFGGELELATISTITGSGTVDEFPTPVATTYAAIATGQMTATKLEGVLVQAGATTATAYNAMYGEITCVDSGSNTIIIDDLLYAQPSPQVGQAYTSVTGLLALRNAASNLEPRNAADLVFGAPGLAALSPALVYARVGDATTSTIPQKLMIDLSGPAQGATTVHVTSSDAALTVADVIVPDGAMTAEIPVTAVSANPNVTVTATLGAQTKTATVHVMSATEVPATATLSPADASVTPMGSTTLTITLDVPAPAAGQSVGLSATSGTIQSTVLVMPNQTTTTVVFTDTVGSGSSTVSAKIGTTVTSTATVTVNTGASHLVINEVDYDNPGTDTAEFVEIYNPSGAAISLAGVQLLIINGSGSGSVKSTIDLSSAGSLASHNYLVVAGTGVTVMAPAVKIDPGWTQDAVENGAPDGVCLVDSNAHTLIDALSYEGSIGAISLPGFAAPVSLVEGTAATAKDTGAGSMCRNPNGQDTDNANNDWALCATTTPGTAN